MRGPSFWTGGSVLIGRRMESISSAVATVFHRRRAMLRMAGRRLLETYQESGQSGRKSTAEMGLRARSGYGGVDRQQLLRDLGAVAMLQRPFAAAPPDREARGLRHGEQPDQRSGQRP